MVHQYGSNGPVRSLVTNASDTEAIVVLVFERRVTHLGYSVLCPGKAEVQRE